MVSVRSLVQDELAATGQPQAINFFAMPDTDFTVVPQEFGGIEAVGLFLGSFGGLFGMGAFVLGFAHVGCLRKREAGRRNRLRGGWLAATLHEIETQCQLPSPLASHIFPPARLEGVLFSHPGTCHENSTLADRFYPD